MNLTKDNEPHTVEKRQHDEIETSKDLQHAKCQYRSTDTQTEFQKPSHLKDVERLVKQYTHASYAMASVYAQEIEKLCKFEPDQKTNMSNNTEPEMPTNLSYKQPCCSLAGQLRTYLLQNVLSPSNTDLHILTSQPDHDLPSTQKGRDEQPSSPVSDNHGTSSGSNLATQIAQILSTKFCIFCRSTVNVKGVYRKSLILFIFSPLITLAGDTTQDDLSEVVKNFCGKKMLLSWI